jgi:hypothetical protein
MEMIKQVLRDLPAWMQTVLHTVSLVTTDQLFLLFQHTIS